MNITTTRQQTDRPSRPAVDPEIHNTVQTLLASFHADDRALERRRRRRYPFPHLIHLTPLAADGRSASGPPIVAVCKQLSEGGIGFFHPHPLPHRKMIVAIELSDGRRWGLVVDLTWCRFTPHGWYESGGRFMRTAANAIPPVCSAILDAEYQI